jgi:hypothetical protein
VIPKFVTVIVAACAPLEARANSGGQIVEDNHALSPVEKGVNHMASYVAGAAGNQDR